MQADGDENANLFLLTLDLDAANDQDSQKVSDPERQFGSGFGSSLPKSKIYRSIKISTDLLAWILRVVRLVSFSRFSILLQQPTLL